MRIILPTSFLWWTDVENKWKIELALFGTLKPAKLHNPG